MNYLVVLLWVVSLPLAWSYCWQVGKNPHFVGVPQVRQIDPDEVEVSWHGIVKNLKCADQFLVKFWRASNPAAALLTPMLDTKTFSTRIKVVPRIPYEFQVIAREDKGTILGVDYNRAKVISFTTSTHGQSEDPFDSHPSSAYESQEHNGDEDSDPPFMDHQQGSNYLIIVYLTLGMMGVLFIFLLIAYLIRKAMIAMKDEDE